MVQQSDADFARTDVRTEAVKSLQHAGHLAMLGASDAYYLKWSLLAIANSLQAFILASLSTPQIPLLHERTRREWEQHIAATRGEGAYPEKVWLPGLQTLYEKAKELHDYTPDAATENGMRLLIEFRDSFIHYWPTTAHSIEADYMRALAQSALKVIEFLGWESHRKSLMWGSADEEARIFQLLLAIRELVATI